MTQHELHIEISNDAMRVESALHALRMVKSGFVSSEDLDEIISRLEYWQVRLRRRIEAQSHPT